MISFNIILIILISVANGVKNVACGFVTTSSFTRLNGVNVSFINTSAVNPEHKKHSPVKPIASSTKKPFYSYPTRKPVHSTIKPVNKPTSMPVKKSPSTKQPQQVHKPPTSKPIYHYPSSKPAFKYPSKKPVNKPPTTQPIYTYPSKMPSVSSNSKSPSLTPTHKPTVKPSLKPSNVPTNPTGNAFLTTQTLGNVTVTSLNTNDGILAFKRSILKSLNDSSVTIDQIAILNMTGNTHGVKAYYKVFFNSVNPKATYDKLSTSLANSITSGLFINTLKTEAQQLNVSNVNNVVNESFHIHTLETASPPTLEPSTSPTIKSSFKPTVIPSTNPSMSPTCEPSFVPTFPPTNEPSTSPTVEPSFVPSSTPSAKPTAPTYIPTLDPSSLPTVVPSIEPSTPTFIPTVIPSSEPSVNPSSVPTVVPSVQPSAPTYVPSFVPSIQPTTSLPTVTPTTSLPTVTPTFRPSIVPTVSLTYSPSVTPTTHIPTSPTLVPTYQPSSEPSLLPTSPTVTPTLSPTIEPSISHVPTVQPITGVPSRVPSVTPTQEPSVIPTHVPSLAPTFKPSCIPTATPTYKPTISPTYVPTVTPSYSQAPSLIPTHSPSVTPTTTAPSAPTVEPSVMPSTPTSVPSFLPSSTPSFAPTMIPVTVKLYPANTNNSFVYLYTSQVYFNAYDAGNFTVVAYNNSVTPNTFNILFGKYATSDGDGSRVCDKGLGIYSHDRSIAGNEIPIKSAYVQFDFGNIGAPYDVISFSIGSIELGEGFQLYGSNESGKLGSLVYTSPYDPTVKCPFDVKYKCGKKYRYMSIMAVDNGYLYGIGGVRKNDYANVLANAVTFSVNPGNNGPHFNNCTAPTPSCYCDQYVQSVLCWNAANPNEYISYYQSSDVNRTTNYIVPNPNFPAISTIPVSCGSFTGYDNHRNLGIGYVKSGPFHGVIYRNTSGAVNFYLCETGAVTYLPYVGPVSCPNTVLKAEKVGIFQDSTATELKKDMQVTIAVVVSIALALVFIVAMSIVYRKYRKNRVIETKDSHDLLSFYDVSSSDARCTSQTKDQFEMSNPSLANSSNRDSRHTSQTEDQFEMSNPSLVNNHY